MLLGEEKSAALPQSFVSCAYRFSGGLGLGI